MRGTPTPFVNHGRSLSASDLRQNREGWAPRSRGLLENPRSESRGERVSQRDSESCGSGRTELLIIVDQIKVSFRPNKEVSTKVLAQAGAEVSHEVIAADKVGAADRATTGEALVEAQALPSDACRKFGGCALAQLRGVNPIKIVEK